MLVWVNRNRGMLTAIADKSGKSVQFVHLVTRGERSSRDGVVERLLREAGAPMPEREAQPV